MLPRKGRTTIIDLHYRIKARNPFKIYIIQPQLDSNFNRPQRNIVFIMYHIGIEFHLNILVSSDVKSG